MISESIASSVDHLARMNARIDKLESARNTAADQVVYRISQDYAAGLITPLELLEIRNTMIGTRGGWNKRWDAYGLPKPYAINRMLNSKPNGPNGSWRGSHTYATAANPMPAPGVSVVYVLYDANNEPCYVGSSEQFQTRLRTHIRNGKPVAYWTAFPCSDRAAAYELEDRLLKQHKPYLNLKNSA